MSNIGFATLSVIPSFQGFQSKLTAGTVSPMAAAGKNGGKKFGDAAGREAGESFRGRFSGALKGFAPLAGLAAGAGGIAFLKSAIDGASDLSESGNKINAVFGDAQGQVQTFASTAADALGQTRLQALDAASTFGTFGKAAGLSGDALAGFSTELVSLATDMASFYNTDVDTAIQAIGSGLRGEAEPLRQFGVLLDDATLRAEALKQGLISSTKEALTPQQKVLASHAVIMRQTSDAQGDFARTSDGLANMQRTLTAQWEEMKTAVGEELLPAMTSFVGFLSDDALPALSEAGSLAKESVEAFNGLPGPVKAAAAAFVALRIAAATSLGTTVAAGAASMGSAMTGLRIRTMFAADAFRQARAGSLMFAGNTGRFVAPVGRMSASMSALGAATAGAGASMRRGLSGMVGILGGPWGMAMIGAVAILGKFWAEHAKAKQRVDDLADSLDKQTGELTENTRELAKQTLYSTGAYEAAERLGLNLETVTDAALGNQKAFREVAAVIDGYKAGASDAGGAGADFALTLRQTEQDAYSVGEAIGNTGSELGTAREKLRMFAEAGTEAAEATDDAAASTRTYADRLADARNKVQALMDAEEKRANKRVQRRRDELGLLSTLEDVRKEAREGKKTLDENTEAGRANWEALLDLADQWNTSTDKVRNSKGAYKDMRQNFVDLAVQMGATQKRAERLAERFLTLPDKKRMHVETPGMDKALADVQRLKEAAAAIMPVVLPVGGGRPQARLNGGPVSAGTPYLVGERRPEVFVPDRPGRIEPRVSGGNTYNVTVVADDPWAWKREMDHMQRATALGGADFR